MKRAHHGKKAIWSGVLVLASAATAWTLRPQPIPVTTAPVTRGALASTVSGEGRTRVRDLFVVSAPVDGELERVSVEPGDSVHPNDTLASIRPVASRPLDARSRAEANAAAMLAKAATERAEAAEAEARVALEHAESQLQTTRLLVQSAVVPAQEVTHRGHEAEMRRRSLEASMAASGQARAELARANAVLGSARDTSQPTTVRSPAAGRILRVIRESAGPIHAGTPLLELGDVSGLEIDADLLSSDAAAIRQGGAATVTSWGGSRGLPAPRPADRSGSFHQSLGAGARRATRPRHPRSRGAAARRAWSRLPRRCIDRGLGGTGRAARTLDGAISRRQRLGRVPRRRSSRSSGSCRHRSDRRNAYGGDQRASRRRRGGHAAIRHDRRRHASETSMSGRQRCGTLPALRTSSTDRQAK